MRWQRLFLLIILLPTLMYGMHRSDCDDILEKVHAEWQKHEALIQQFQANPYTDEGLQLLHQSIACCKQAIVHCDCVLDYISWQSRKRRREAWRAELKHQCTYEKRQLNTEIEQLQGESLRVKVNIVAVGPYSTAVKEAQGAQENVKACQKGFNSIVKVVDVLNETSHIHSQAAKLVAKALGFIEPFDQKADKDHFKKCIADYEEKAKQYKAQALEWPALAIADCQKKITAIKADCEILTQKGLKRVCYELQNHALYIIEKALEGYSGDTAPLQEDRLELETAMTAFEKTRDAERLTDVSPLLAKEDFENQEKTRRELFFKSHSYLPSSVKSALSSKVTPLDGQKQHPQGEFALYADQFYRFLVQSDTLDDLQLVVQVLEEGQLIHTENIDLKVNDPVWWQQYLQNGLLFIPDTKLKADFGFDLHVRVPTGPTLKTLVIAQKSTDTRYQFAVSLKDTPLYSLKISAPPPWQLEILKKPDHIKPGKLFSSLPLNMQQALQGLDKQLASSESDPILDRLVEEHKSDPLALASFVHNEIALVDPFVHQEKGVLYPLDIQRAPARTFLDKQGSPWEQCQLLVYLLRKAGFQAVYALGECTLPKEFAKRMLSATLPQGAEKALLKYPWVVFFNGEKWVSLFPWMKDIRAQEGHELYGLLPEKYATAGRWIKQYLKADEEILKHIGPDADDTAGVLFIRFVEEQLRKQGLSLDDVGMQRTQLKRQFFSWEDFPHPTITSEPKIYRSLDEVPGIHAMMQITMRSREQPHKWIQYTLPISHLSQGVSCIRFSPQGDDFALLADIGGKKAVLPLSALDQVIDISVSVYYLLGTLPHRDQRIFSLHKGTCAAFCAHFGSPSPEVTAQYQESLRTEKEEPNTLVPLLSFMGASYFEKYSRSINAMAALHKIRPTTLFSLGLVKLAPDVSKGPFKGDEDLCMPQVDMHCFYARPDSLSLAHANYHALAFTTLSSNEHHVLREFFKDAYAVSTVKVLQLAHLKQQLQGLEGDGFLSLTSKSMQDCTLETLKKAPQWNILKTLLDPKHPESRFTYAYTLPGSITSLDETRTETAALIISPHTGRALISTQGIVINGGVGAPLSRHVNPKSIMKGDLTRAAAEYYAPKSDTQRSALSPEIRQHLNPTSLRSGDLARAAGYMKGAQTDLVQETLQPTELTPDVRLDHKGRWDTVSDPVDVITGAFYIDETDLNLCGLALRRNYSSKNPIAGELGYGWKLSLNPYLSEQNGKRLASELDGTVIVYSYNAHKECWEVLPENNPELSNFNGQGMGSPFHAYMKQDVLYGADGSKRFYAQGLLQKYIDIRGHTLIFSYKEGHLARIESSNGDFCGFHMTPSGRIFEIYARDGRRIYYTYDACGDLVKVTLPNAAEIHYTYDRNHRILREVKPHGRVLENVYDDTGKVKEQRSPTGFLQQMVTTATFEYAEGKTVVTDANGAKTLYYIHDKQIYKVIDPLGFTTLRAWFIDPTSWFDPQTETILPWNEAGGAFKSIKATTDKRGLTTSYFYDAQGNPTTITLEGEDLTGNGESKLTKTRSYNENNLCLQEEAYGHKTLTTYDTRFPYLPKRIENYHESTLTSYVELDYNALGQIEKEDQNGAITLWKHSPQGLPVEKTQPTGTDDPDVVTTFAYNRQGQCLKCISPDATYESIYDLMGNEIASKVFSPSHELMAAVYTEYDLNNAPISKQTANPNNIVYYDYHAAGYLKAKRQALAPSPLTAYTLYTHDPCGYLTEEVDPRGYVTYRDYDLLGRIIAETKEGHTTRFSYEEGGLLETCVLPSKATRTHVYTTNGLLKECIHPDGTKEATIYDIFGRPILETHNRISWAITYDDALHRITKTHLATGNAEISQYDARGNLITFTDAAGFTATNTYDCLGRLKITTTPSGVQTKYSYCGNEVICTGPNGEVSTTHYVAGRAVKVDITDPQGTLIATSSVHIDPEHDKEETLVGEHKTITWNNSLGLPIKLEGGNNVSNYAYDACGNCICSTDADEQSTHQTYDGLGRLIEKQLPDNSILAYVYDADSNLSEYHLPNGTTWKASFDLMQRKTSEELVSSTVSSGHWTFTHEDGYLISATDPMCRTHTYLYDSYGRLLQDTVEDYTRTYTYEPRGYLATVDQSSPTESTRVERAYDEDGNLTLESIYLNTQLLQQTHQTWTPSSRSLRIGATTLDYLYQNHQLIQASSPHSTLTYAYDLSGALKSKTQPLASVTFDYNASGLLQSILTQLPVGPSQENLKWYPSGKLLSHIAPNAKQHFTYNAKGYLRSTGTENYDFDFGAPGIGVRTTAPTDILPQDSLDPFGRALFSTSLPITYNAMGEVITHGQKELSWDPWGKLVKILSSEYAWEASYDALGRRLQTRFSQPDAPTNVTTSFYDPDEEFREIGLCINGTTFWKLYGPDACDAISDTAGNTVTLMHNALRQLHAVISAEGTFHNTNLPSAYGPLEAGSIPDDLLSYAKSLTWHSKALDPTGFMWLGDRYLDCHSGKFLSQDPISYPNCIDLYAYAGGDPINYHDLDGRCFSYAYGRIETTALSVWENPSFQYSLQALKSLATPAYNAGESVGSYLWNSPRFQGSLQAFGGLTEVGFGGGMTYATGGWAAPAGWAVMAHGLDYFATGMRMVITGRYGETATSQMLQKAGMSARTANFIDSGMSMGGVMGGFAVLQHSRIATTSFLIKTRGFQQVTKAVTQPNGNTYSVAFETRLSINSYPGVSRARHFQEANIALLQSMEESTQFSQMVQKLGINLERTPTGLAPRIPPVGWTWHHATENGVMQLVPRTQHTPGSIFWDTLHPGGQGGYSIWGQQ